MGCLLARERSPLPPPPSSIVRVDPRGSRRDLIALVPSPREVAGCSCSSCATVDGRDGKALGVSVRDGKGWPTRRLKDAEVSCKIRRGRSDRVWRRRRDARVRECSTCAPCRHGPLQRILSSRRPTNGTLAPERTSPVSRFSLSRRRSGRCPAGSRGNSPSVLRPSLSRLGGSSDTEEEMRASQVATRARNRPSPRAPADTSLAFRARPPFQTVFTAFPVVCSTRKPPNDAAAASRCDTRVTVGVSEQGLFFNTHTSS